MHLGQGGPALRGYFAGSGPPLLLVHSVNAAAAAAEVRPLHERYRVTHTVLSSTCRASAPPIAATDRTARA